MAGYIERQHQRDQSKMMVAAIDLGTTYSGYAFAFRHDIEKDKLKIYGHQWSQSDYMSLKTPTCVLFDADQKFVAFGYEAEDKYAELTIEETHRNWFYFRRFKMHLYYAESINKDIKIEDECGKLMSAMKLFSACIGYLKKQLLKQANEREIDEIINEKEIFWVLTVPAIWSDQAKLFMRKAAEAAGIAEDNLDLALEPEAASIFSKEIAIARRESIDSETKFNTFQPGNKYMVLDAGGGTVDITVQQIQENGKIHQLHKANGGDWGGVRIDEAFEKHVLNLVGEETIAEFKNDHFSCYLEMFREFEIKKRSISVLNEGKVTFKIPYLLAKIFEKNKGMTLNDSLKGKKTMTWIGDKLRMDATLAKGMFKETCEAIVELIREIFTKPEASDTEYILMVGGFSESEMLQNAIKCSFNSSIKVIVPEEAGLAVLKGAVLYGFDTQIISVRIMRETYGIQTCQIFEDGIDPENRKEVVEKQVYCNDKFSRHVTLGEAVPLTTPTKELQYFPLTANQSRICFRLFKSQKQNPTYCEHEGCTYIYKMDVELPEGKTEKDKEVKVNLLFGGTEIVMKGVATKTGNETKCTVHL